MGDLLESGNKNPISSSNKSNANNQNEKKNINIDNQSQKKSINMSNQNEKKNMNNYLNEKKNINIGNQNENKNKDDQNLKKSINMGNQNEKKYMDNQNQKKNINIGNQNEKKYMDNQSLKKNMNNYLNEKKNINMDNQKGKEHMNMNNQNEKKNMNTDSQIGMNMNIMDNKKGMNINMDNQSGIMNMNMGYPAGMMNMNMGYPSGMMNMNMGYPSGMMNMNMGYPARMMNMNMGYPAGMMNMNMGYPARMMNMNMGYPARMMSINNQMEMNNMNMANQMGMDDEQQNIQNLLKYQGYEIIKFIYKTKYGKLFLISNILNKNRENIYFLNKIEIKSKLEKKKFEKEIDNLKAINSKYIMKINEYYFFSEKEKEILLIILNYYENNLFKIIYESNFLTSRYVWKIFIQIILGLNSLNLNNIKSDGLIPQNIYIDNENNIKIGGINMILDIADESLQESILISYCSPEIIKKEKNDEKSIIWSIGCILYELAFKKPTFFDNNIEDIKDKILNINYNLPDECEQEISFILQKLICKKMKRLTIKELISEKIFKKKIFEVNLFSEIIKNNKKDFNNYFSHNARIFDEKEAINIFRLIELNEFPFYLICKKCNNIPEIELKDNEIVSITCSQCNNNVNERIENLVNCSSKYISNAKKFCNSKHEEITPSYIFCKTHDLFLCKNCFNNHKNEVPIGDDIIKVYFKSSSNFEKDFYFSNNASIYKIIKIFMKNIDHPENLEKQKIFFLFNGQLIDIESRKSLKQSGIINGSHILIIDSENYIGRLTSHLSYLKESFWVNDHNFIRLYNLKKNICLYHNKNLILNCIQCNMEICEECKKESHYHHLTEKIDKKNINLKNDYMEFENFLIQKENMKKEILNKVQEDIIWFENCKEINKDELNNIIKKLLTKFYKDLEKGQNLIFFSKILFNSFIRMGKEYDKRKQYNNNIKIINQIFGEEKIKEYDLSNFPAYNEYKDKCKCIFESNSYFIPQIDLKFNDVNKIDKDIINSLRENLMKIFKGKDVKIIEIKKGSLSACIALNYLIKEKLEKINMEDKTAKEIIKEFNKSLGIETKNVKEMLINNLSIAQKDKEFKPDFATEKLYDLESNPDELLKCIVKNKNSNDDVNIYEVSKTITKNDIKNFFDLACDKTKEIQENVCEEEFVDSMDEIDNYLQLFEDNYEEALKESIFEYNTKNIYYIYRNDEDYNSGQLRCRNITKKILFHGTNSYCISRILKSHFKKSDIHAFGPGFYFSDSLDYTWYYADDSGEIGSRKNFNNIPKINESFSFIVVNTYYDIDKFEQVYSQAKENIEVPEFGIRHILVDCESNPIRKYRLRNYSKFIGREYLISNSNQIFPLLSITVERVPYLIVWRDNNFNPSNPNRYSEYDKMLEFNRETQVFASRNLKTKIYYFNESVEALEFIKRKKYNKIILITNGGNNGKKFINDARKIIGNNTIALITCFVAENYLNIVQKMENVLLNSEFCTCMKQFLSIVCHENLTEIRNLLKDIEKKYQELDNLCHFKEINENAFYFPNFKESGKFEDLDFKDNFNS